MNRSRSYAGIAGLVSIWALLWGCGAEPGAVEGSSEEPGEATLPSEIPPPPAEYEDRHGRRWLRVGPAEMSVGTLPARRAPADVSDDGEYVLPGSIEELAEEIRAVSLVAGYEYIEAEPPLEKARNMWNRLKNGIEDAGPRRGEPSHAAMVERVARTNNFSPDRIYDASTDYPARTVVFNDMGGTSGCSGAMISRGTMLTAAHCVYNTTANTWFGATFYPGSNVDHSTSPVPYGSVTCFTRSVPQAYKDYATATPVTTLQYDYASVDFNGLKLVGTQWIACEDPVGDESGYMGWWVITSQELAARSTWSKGYPVCNDDYSCTDFFSNGGDGIYQNGMGAMTAQNADPGQTWVTIGTSYRLETNLESQSGQSGSNMYALDGTFPYVIGILHGHSSGHFYYRRFDATVRDFVSTESDYIESSDSWGPATNIQYPCENRTPGASDFCTAECPCVHGEGDCDSSNCGPDWCVSDQCAPGLVCAIDKGPMYAMSSTSDVCMLEACAERSMGDSGYCSSGCPCGYGGGDCDGNSQCMSGLVCVTDQGAAFGQPAVNEVCLTQACANRGLAINHADYCSSTCPCGAGGGDCDTDADCLQGLTCVQISGTDFCVE